MTDLDRIETGVFWLDRYSKYRDSDMNKKGGLAVEYAKNHIAMISRVKQYCDQNDQIYPILKIISRIKDADLRKSLSKAVPDKKVENLTATTSPEVMDIVDRYFQEIEGE